MAWVFGSEFVVTFASDRLEEKITTRQTKAFAQRRDYCVRLAAQQTAHGCLARRTVIEDAIADTSRVGRGT